LLKFDQKERWNLCWEALGFKGDQNELLQNCWSLIADIAVHRSNIQHPSPQFRWMTLENRLRKRPVW
jgi:hypothetical protein